jgi:hypothetical protein
MTIILSELLPIELIDKVLLYCSKDDIKRIGKENVSEYIWLRKSYDMCDFAMMLLSDMFNHHLKNRNPDEPNRPIDSFMIKLLEIKKD